MLVQQERVVHRLLAVWTESKVVSLWLTWEEVKRRRVHEQQRQQHKEERTQTRRKRKKHERRHFVSKQKQQEWSAIRTQHDVALFLRGDDDDDFDHLVTIGDGDETPPPKVSDRK